MTGPDQEESPQTPLITGAHQVPDDENRCICTDPAEHSEEPEGRCQSPKVLGNFCKFRGSGHEYSAVGGSWVPPARPSRDHSPGGGG